MAIGFMPFREDPRVLREHIWKYFCMYCVQMEQLQQPIDVEVQATIVHALLQLYHGHEILQSYTPQNVVPQETSNTTTATESGGGLGTNLPPCSHPRLSSAETERTQHNIKHPVDVREEETEQEEETDCSSRCNPDNFFNLVPESLTRGVWTSVVSCVVRWWQAFRSR